MNTWRFWLELKSGGWGQLVSKSKVVQFCHMDLDWPSIWPSKLHCTIFKYNKHKKLLSFLPFLSFFLIQFLHRNVFNHLNDWPLSETDRNVSTAPLYGYYKQLHQHKPTIHTYGCSGVMFVDCNVKCVMAAVTYHLKSNVLKVTWFISTIPFTVCLLFFFLQVSSNLNTSEVSMETSFSSQIFKDIVRDVTSVDDD